MKLSTVRNTIFISLAMVFIILSFNFFAIESKGFFYSVFSPVQKVLWQGGQNISGFFGTVGQLGSLQSKNQELEIKYTQLLAENVQLKEIKKENETLREALGLQFQKDFNMILAQTISRDPSQDFIMIDKGSKDGVAVGMPVITSKKILCGRVSEVYDKFSRIMLLSATASSFDAKVSDQDIFGVVKGTGGLSLEITLVPREKDIKIGDQIITSPLEGIFPQGLLVGTIKDIIKKDADPFQSAIIQPLFNLQDLNMVFVVLNTK